VSPDPRYEEPFAWWGPGRQVPAPHGIADVLRDETIDSWTAANLWAGLARRRSLAVVAGGSGVGKTTLLTALLDFLPSGTRRVYPRGCFETFAFLSDPTINPLETTLMINEISPHLPVYLWGPAVGRIMEASQRGFMLLATAHANSVHDFVGALTGSPLHIRADQTAAFEFVVVLERDDENQSGRRVRGVWRLEPTRDGVAVASLRQQDSEANDISQEEFSKRHDRTSWFPQRDLARRQRILEDLRDWHIAHLPIGSVFADTNARDRDLEP
jgi:ABC-type cobalamin/Fe3+-siderophores transport system ATPase subunit